MQGNKRVVSDDACKDLVRHFSRYRLRSEDFQFSDLLGSAYEFLKNGEAIKVLKKLQKAAAKRGSTDHDRRAFAAVEAGLTSVFDQIESLGAELEPYEQRVADVADRVGDELGLSAEERETLLPSGRQRVLNNRIYWAKFYMHAHYQPRIH